MSDSTTTERLRVQRDSFAAQQVADARSDAESEEPGEPVVERTGWPANPNATERAELEARKADGERLADSLGMRYAGGFSVDTGKTYKTAKVDRGAMDEAMKEFDRGLDAVAAELAASVPPKIEPLVLVGPQLAAYLRLQAAARAAHAAQESMATTGTALRDAIAELCKAVTG